MKPHLFLIFMNLADVVRIHDMVISRFGGRPGLHDHGLLESAINHPWMIIEFGNEKEQEISNLAAAYFFHIIKNHPFLDGNKRTGLLTAIEFMYRNGFEVKGTFGETYENLYQLSLTTALSQTNQKEIAIFFKKIMKKIK